MNQAALITMARRWPRKLPTIQVRWVRLPDYPREYTQYSATEGYFEEREKNQLQITQTQLSSNTYDLDFEMGQADLISKAK